jgi:hypothetical protein
MQTSRRRSASGCATIRRRLSICSGCESLVAVVQPADLWECDDPASPRRLDITRVWTILVERKVSAGVVVVLRIRRKNASQMALVEDNQVVQTLARIDPMTLSI